MVLLDFSTSLDAPTASRIHAKYAEDPNANPAAATTLYAINRHIAGPDATPADMADLVSQALTGSP